MLGFVSALSSAVAVMILLMAVLLTNLLSVTLQQDKKKEFANIIYPNGGSEEKSKKAGPSKGFALSATDILPLRNSKKGVEIIIYCTYGNNLSLDTAKKYTTYNFIVAKKILTDTDKISVKEPVYKPNIKNNCIAEGVAK